MCLIIFVSSEVLLFLIDELSLYFYALMSILSIFYLFIFIF